MNEEEMRSGIDRIVALLAASVRLQMSPLLKEELRSPFEKKLFELTGVATSRDIQKQLKCSPNRVSEIWSRWEQLGIVIKDGKSYRKVV